MRLLSAILLGALLGSASAGLALQDGREYTYETDVLAMAGTMDYATASSGFAYKMTTTLQVHGNALKVKLSDMRHTEYVGMHEAMTSPFLSTKYAPIEIPGGKVTFIVNHNDDGLFESLQFGGGESTVFGRNMARGFAAQMQINTKEIKAGRTAFTSEEYQLQGHCNITYTVNDAMLIKSVSHNDDCHDRVFRLVDDFRGWRCDGESRQKGPGYPSSLATTAFILAKNGDATYTIKRMVSSGTYISQMYEEEGSSQIVRTNSTHLLVSERASPNDITATGETSTELFYEWGDAAYKWDVDRDLKAKEPFFSTGTYYEEDMTKIVEGIKKGISFQKTIVETLSKDTEALQKAHQYGINNILPAFYALDYASLKGLADELFADKSETGVTMSNVFGELISSAGTTAAALVIRDLVIEKKFDNDRDAARALSGVPFHIRRPNTQLVKEFEKLTTEIPEERSLVRMAVSLTLGHLIKMVCMRAGTPMSTEVIKCFGEFAHGYNKKAWEKYQGSTSREEKSRILAAMSNIKFGGQAELLKPLIMGKIDKDDHQLRTQALWAAAMDGIWKSDKATQAMRIFADRSFPHEMRIAALEIAFRSPHPRAAHFSTLTAVLYKEPDYEVINYAFALLERTAADINPCHEKIAHLAAYYLKYLKQFSNYEVDFGFGVSKTYGRQFHKKKYGYGGGMIAYVVGSEKSTTPLKVGMGYTSHLMNNYHINMFSVHLRIEGLAKALIRKFKTTDPTTWKTEDLAKILTGSMGIRERPDQPVRCQITVHLKSAIVFHRLYDETDGTKEGKLAALMDKFKDLGETYTINHQRAMQLGALLYEQPTNVGLPMAVMSSITAIGSLKATVQRGNHRGLLFRDVKYDVNTLTQAVRVAFVMEPWAKASYGIVNDRIYHAHLPRKFVIGANPIKKELKISISRPAYDNPMKLFMHSQTSVLVRGHNMKGDYKGLKEHCPTCENRVVISKGADHVKSRVFVDRENQKVGSYLHGEFFGCELDINRGNTVGNLVGAFMPYNKTPKTLWTSITMGMRQIRAFLLHFPKTEQCGAYLTWSQSKNNPVNEIEISVRANMEANGERLFFKGSKWFIKALVKAKGEPEDRSYRINVAYEYTPGHIQNSLKIQINRAPLEALSMGAYSICFAYENEYPSFSSEFMGYEESSEMAVTGKAMVQYGAAASCADADGEIRLKFKHSTTTQAREDLKEKWYYKQCMELKSSPAWAGRKNIMPVSESCFKTVWDATSARKYTFNLEFVKVTPRMQNILSKVQTAVKAGLLPYWDMDPEALDAVDDTVGPYMNIEATFKNKDKAMDIRVETRKGDEEFDNIPLSLDWTKKLRNLKFTGTLKRLFYSKIISPCITTSETIRTNDNVTLTYVPSKCWTLTSATCGPNPSYAVFTKKVAGSLPIAGKVYVGGHSVEFTPTGSGTVEVKVNDAKVEVEDEETHEHTVDGVEIFKIFRWGSSYHVSSFLRVWVSYDGNFLQVVPAPSAVGQHCGICGNYNRDQHDELTGKTEQTLANTEELVKEWEWQC